MRQKVVGGGLALIGRQIISFPINLIGITLTSRLLDPDDYGALAILLPTISLALFWIDLGTSPALVQSKDFPSFDLRKRILRLKFVNGLIAILLLALLSTTLASIFDLPASLLLLFPAAGVIGYFQSYRAYKAVGLQRLVEWRILARIEVVEIAAYNVLLVLLAYYLRSAWCFAIALGLRAIVGVLLLLVNSPGLDNDNESSSKSLRPLLRFGIPLQATALFGILNGLVNPVVVGQRVGIVAVGLVNWSSSIVAIPTVPLQPMPRFLFSVLSERRRQDQNDNDLIGAIAFVGMILVSYLSLLLALAIEFLIDFVFGNQWLGASPIIVVLIIGNVITFPIMLIAAQLTARGYSTLWLVANILGTILLWVGTILLTANFGTRGYAYSWVGSAFFALIFLSIVGQRILHLNIHWTDSLYTAIAMIISLMFAQSLFGFTESNGLYQVIGKIVSGTISFALLSLPLNYFRRNEWRIFISLLPFPQLRSSANV